MYSKVINPAKEGQIAYNNKGSSARLGNYLEKELDLKITPDGKMFFNDKGDFTKDEMVFLLDKNQKGLRENDDKFYSLVISPSSEELLHIGNDTQKLKGYTEKCMQNYGQNFDLKNKQGESKTFNVSDLVWFAIIENNRTFKGTDKEVLEEIKKQGDPKEGLQTHIHITVSARDEKMKTTLNPLTNNKNRFSIISWAKENQTTFDRSFGYESKQKSFKNENKEVWNKVISVERQLSNFETKYGLNNQDSFKLRTIAIEKGYSKDFRDKLKDLGKDLRQHGAVNGLSKPQLDNLLESQKDDRSHEGRLENTLSKMKTDFNLADESETTIRKIAEVKEMSFDFFDKLKEVNDSWKEQAAIEKQTALKESIETGKPNNPKSKYLSVVDKELLLSATLDDRSREGRLEKTLAKMKTDFNLSNRALHQIQRIANRKGFSNDFFENLTVVSTALISENKQENDLKPNLHDGKEIVSIKFEKELSNEHLNLLNSSEAFSQNGFNIASAFRINYNFFEGTEGFGANDNKSTKFNFINGVLHKKRRSRVIQQNNEVSR